MKILKEIIIYILIGAVLILIAYLPVLYAKLHEKHYPPDPVFRNDLQLYGEYDKIINDNENRQN
jgi:hypothetical protein